MDDMQIDQDSSSKFNKHLQWLDNTNKLLPTLRTQFEKYNKTLQLLEDIYQQRSLETDSNIPSTNDH